MKKILPKVKKIINMSIKQAKFYGDNEVKIEHIINIIAFKIVFNGFNLNDFDLIKVKIVWYIFIFF